MGRQQAVLVCSLRQDIAFIAKKTIQPTSYHTQHHTVNSEILDFVQHQDHYNQSKHFSNVQGTCQEVILNIVNIAIVMNEPSELPTSGLATCWQF